MEFREFVKMLEVDRGIMSQVPFVRGKMWPADSHWGPAPQCDINNGRHCGGGGGVTTGGAAPRMKKMQKK
jgi:hypothetical protein